MSAEIEELCACSHSASATTSPSPGPGALTREAMTSGCTGVSGPEELRVKLSATPDFDAGAHYCRGTGRHCVRGATTGDFCVKLVAHAHLPSRFGEGFEMYGFYDAREDKEHTAMVVGDVRGQQAVPVRVHSECHTGDVMGSLRCDCRDQLEASLRFVAQQPCGAVLYLKQEGRGIGLLNKIKAYRLQELGLDTVEANVYLGFPEEARDYKVAAKMLALLGIGSVQLITNNPDKIDKLTKEGVVVDSRIPLVIPPTEHSKQYLSVKQSKMGHIFPDQQ